jgi:putative tryptophan/tyrosine transport system substrate-binding protein
MRANKTSVRIAFALLVLGVGLLGMPSLAMAQNASPTLRLGWLEVCGPGPQRGHFDLVRKRLSEQGYVEGKNLVIEQRFADCRYERMPVLARELVQIPVDVLFTIGTRATRIVAATVKSIPVVTYSCDPFAHVERLARPGGNLTGVTCMTTELMPKRLEILKELVPRISRVTLLQDPEAATNAFELTLEVARRLGVQLRAAQVTAAEDFLPELAAIEKDRPDGLLVYPDMVLSSHPRPKQLGDFALKARIPTMHAFRFYADAGGLVSYGATPVEVYTSAAEQIAKILSGVRPGELPLRQATRFELVINNKTAKTLGIAVPPTLLARADAVIE